MCSGSTNDQFVRRGQWAICEIGNANTVTKIYFTLIFTFFGFNIELCALNSTLPAEFLEYAVYEEFAALIFKAYQSVHCLLCMHQPGFPLVSQEHPRPSLHLPFNLRIFCHNWQPRKSSRCNQCCLLTKKG